MFDNVFQGRRVFVTGHTGFKGSWLCTWLKLLGAEVHGYSLDPVSEPSLFSALELQNQIHHAVGNVQDYDSLAKAISEFKPEIVFHLAAQAVVRAGYREPLETLSTNIMGTANLLEACRHCPDVRAIINVTSDKCYENKECAAGYRETDSMGGYDPYSVSKGCSELITAAYRRSFYENRKCATARAGNVIGGGDWAADRLIPDCIRSLVSGETITLRNPQAIRPWQHVLEPLSGYLLLASRLFQNGPSYAEGYNFGPKTASCVPVVDVVNRVVDLWGFLVGGTSKVEVIPSVLHEAGLLTLDISKAKTALGWRPVYSLHETIEETVTWYAAFYGNCGGIDGLTKQQIYSYCHRANEIGLNWATGERHE